MKREADPSLRELLMIGGNWHSKIRGSPPASAVCCCCDIAHYGMSCGCNQGDGSADRFHRLVIGAAFEQQILHANGDESAQPDGSEEQPALALWGEGAGAGCTGGHALQHHYL